jgi:hypothetical protein
MAFCFQDDLLTQILSLVAIPPIFLASFSYEKNIQSWEKVGAVPFTLACLENKCVRREVDDSSDDNGDLKLEQDLEDNCI